MYMYNYSKTQRSDTYMYACTCMVVIWKWNFILFPKQGTIPILFLCFFGLYIIYYYISVSEKAPLTQRAS